MKPKKIWHPATIVSKADNVAEEMEEAIDNVDKWRRKANAAGVFFSREAFL